MEFLKKDQTRYQTLRLNSRNYLEKAEIKFKGKV